MESMIGLIIFGAVVLLVGGLWLNSRRRQRSREAEMEARLDRLERASESKRAQGRA